MGEEDENRDKIDPDIPRLQPRDNTYLLLGITLCCVIFFFIIMGIWDKLTSNKLNMMELLQETNNQLEPAK